MSERRKTRSVDRQHTRDRLQQIEQEGSVFIQETNLGTASIPIGFQEVKHVQDLLQIISPINIDNFKTHAHLQLVSKFAGKITQALIDSGGNEFKELNPQKLEGIGLLHDVGRLVTHKYYRTELVGESLLKRLGVRSDLWDNVPSSRDYLRSGVRHDDEDAINTLFSRLVPEQIISQMADICGKRIIAEDGTMDGILTFEEVMTNHLSSRGNYQRRKEDSLWASERQIDENLILLYEKIYRKEKAWLKAHGVDVEKIRQEILDEEQHALIDTIIFDIGGVVVDGSGSSDDNAIKRIADFLQIPEVDALSLWARYIPQLQTGMKEGEFWEKFKEISGGSFEIPDDVLSWYLNPKINPSVQETIRLLKDRYNLAVLSDTIPPHAKKLKEAGVYADFPVVILSTDVGVTKKSPAAFTVAALRLGVIPKSCLFIDDKDSNVEVARKAGMHAVVYESSDQLKQSLEEILKD